MTKDISDMTLVNNREDIFSEEKKSFLINKMKQIFDGLSRTERPPFPRQVQFETTNICNHNCSFCAYNIMQRSKAVMDVSLFKRLCKEAYDLGAREIGLFSGAEPLTCKNLHHFVSYAHSIGYEYSYISTNGIVGGAERLIQLIDSGLRSIKFSVNGGTREAYLRVHKKDDFEKVIENIKAVSDYRAKVGQTIYLSVSFVECEDSLGTFQFLRELVDGYVDEVIYYKADNQSGQVEGFSRPIFTDCPLPFNKAHFTVEGYLRACCNDYENLLAVEDLANQSMIDAWHSERFRSLRKRHIDDALNGTLCGRCIRGYEGTPEPLNPELANKKIIPLRLDKK